jgi:hypothetical protein
MPRTSPSIALESRLTPPRRARRLMSFLPRCSRRGAGEGEGGRVLPLRLRVLLLFFWLDRTGLAVACRLRLGAGRDALGMLAGGCVRGLGRSAVLCALAGTNPLRCVYWSTYAPTPSRSRALTYSSERVSLTNSPQRPWFFSSSRPSRDSVMKRRMPRLARVRAV